jgi:mannosyltransferase
MSAPRVRMADVEVVVPNFKRRLSGVTSTIIQLVPLQAKTIGIATLGPGLPDHLPKMRWWQLPGLWRRPKAGRPRIWHARRNTEMLGGVILRDVLRMPLKLVFTSASQREHTAWTRFLISRMDAVIATSRKTGAYLKVPHAVIMHGIDTDRFHPAENKQQARADVGLDPSFAYVGCFGRIRHQKGTDLFVDAMIELLPSNPGWAAIIAGRTTTNNQAFEDNLKARIQRAGLSDRIRFVGEHKDIERWYRALDLFVAPQRWEGFGLTPLEAMASGVPVVAADVGAFSELVVPGKAGDVVAREDNIALKAAIRSRIVDRVLVAAEGRESRCRVEAEFVLQREAASLTAIYRCQMDVQPRATA